MNDQADNLRTIVAGGRKILSDAFPREKRMKTITVASGKGGVGKTTFAVNMAVDLCRKGKKVAILDGDMGLANVDILLKLSPSYSLFDVMDGTKTVEEIMIEGPEGLKIIPGGSGLSEIFQFNPIKQRKILQGLESMDENYDYLIIDCGAGISRVVLGFMASSDKSILVVTPEPTSITDAYALIKVADKVNQTERVDLVVNMVSDREEATFTYEKMETVVNKYLSLGIRYLGFVRRDEKVIAAGKEQESFIMRYPKVKAASDLQTVTENIILDKELIGYGGRYFWQKLLGAFR